MKRILLILLLAAFAYPTFGQKAIVLCNDNLSRGQKVLLRFNLYLADGTLPNADIFSLTFPTGIDSLEYVTEEFPFDTLPGQVQAVSNPVVANKMSWGENTFPGEIGGIERETYFFIEVMAYTADTLGDFTYVTYSVSPEGGGGTEEIDSVRINISEGMPDMQVSITEINGYRDIDMYQMPVEQFNYFQPTAQVFNNGKELNNQSFLVFEDIKNAYYSTHALFNPFPEFGFTSVKTQIREQTYKGAKYVVRASVNNNPDLNRNNNIDSIAFEVTDSVLSVTDLSALTNFTNFPLDSMVGTVLQIIQDDADGFIFVDTLTSASIFLNFPADHSIYAEVYQLDETGDPNNGTLLARSETLTQTNGIETPRLYTVNFPDTVLISEGEKFFLAFHVSNPQNMGYGYSDSQSPGVNSQYVKTNGTGWETAESQSGGVLHDFMIGANFGDLPIVTDLKDLSEALNSAVSIYPNPANKVVHVKTQADRFLYTLYSVMGNVVDWGMSEKSIDLRSLPEGVYVIKIQTAGSLRPVVKRLVIAH